MTPYSIHGRVEETPAGVLQIVAGGVGYAVTLPDEEQRLFRARLGTEQTVYIFCFVSLVQGVQPTYFGFLDEHAVSWFRALLEVDGVGPTTALRILNIYPSEEALSAEKGDIVAKLTVCKACNKKVASAIALMRGERKSA